LAKYLLNILDFRSDRNPVALLSDSHQFDRQERMQQPTSATSKSSFLPADAHVLQSFCFQTKPMQRPILLYPQLRQYEEEAVRSSQYTKYSHSPPCENVKLPDLHLVRNAPGIV